jgi:HEAT repeat protein
MNRRVFLNTVLAFVFAFGACRSKSPQRLQQLIVDLSAADPGTRNQAALEISRYGAEGKAAVPALVRLLNTDRNRGIRTSAAVALRAIGTKEAIAALDKYKEDEPD